MPLKTEVEMAKKPDETDIGTLAAPDQVRLLFKSIEAIGNGVGEAIQTIKNIGEDLQNSVQADMQGIKPICDQFPGLCKKVEDLRVGVDEIRPSAITRISQAADNLALHYKECTDPACRRAIEARMAAVGLAKPPDPAAPVETGDHQDHTHVEDKKGNKPPAEAMPWEKLKITEAKYKRNKSYYDDAIKNGA